MKKKNEAERKKSEAIRKKRRGKRLAQQKFVFHRPKYEDNDVVDEEQEVREQTRFAKLSHIFFTVIFLIFISCFLWQMIDIYLHVKVPATITDVIEQTSTSVSYPRGGPGKQLVVTKIITAQVRYYYNDIEYHNSLILPERKSGHIMIYCNKKHPNQCRLHLVEHPILLVCFYIFAFSLFWLAYRVW